MLTATVIFLILGLNTISAHICPNNSNEINSAVNFENLATYNWQVSAKVDLNEDLERPFDFPLHRRMTVEISVNTVDSYAVVMSPFRIELHCADVLLMVQITKSVNVKQGSVEMVNSFCSWRDTIVWPKMFVHFDKQHQMLFFYICNNDIEYLVILSTFEKLSKTMKKTFMKESKKLLSKYNSTLLEQETLSFTDVDGFNSKDCIEIASVCKPPGDSKRPKAEENDFEKMEKVTTMLIIFLCLLILLKFGILVVRFASKKYRN